MHPNLKIWLDGLRSGTYAPGTRQLRDLDGRFCCLGVGCDLMLEHSADPETYWMTENRIPARAKVKFHVERTYVPFFHDGVSEHLMPPPAFSEWIGKPEWTTHGRVNTDTMMKEPRALYERAVPIINEWGARHPNSGFVFLVPDRFDSIFQVFSWYNDGGMKHSLLADLIEHLDKNGI